MSKIPYYFETPIPRYFRDIGWFENENTFKFVVWAFSKCSPEPRKTVMQGKEIILAPFEFIAGRLSSCKECFLTQKELRWQVTLMLENKILEKTANSRANRYTCYKWLVERFSEYEKNKKGQLKGQQGANKGPTKGHNLEDKKIRIKESHHPSIPSSKHGKSFFEDDDDFSSKKIIEEEKTEVLPGVYLTATDLEACMKLKGDLGAIKNAMKFIQESSKRKFPIEDWPSALASWKIPNDTKKRLESNLGLAERLSKQFHSFEKGNGWRCYLYTDKQKDQKGILFESDNGHQKSIFIALIDNDFEDKCRDTVRKYIVGIVQNQEKSIESMNYID